MTEAAPKYRTPIAARRGPPPAPPRRRGRFHAVRNVLRAGTIITLACTSTAASCGLVAGGWHGIVVATALFTAMGILGMSIGMVVAVAVDSTRAVRQGISGSPIVRSEVLERGAGQLSVSGPGSGSLAQVGDPNRPPIASDRAS